MAIGSEPISRCWLLIADFGDLFLWRGGGTLSADLLTTKP
jgi:hypothetical protein